jgi:hypothetical protein
MKILRIESLKLQSGDLILKVTGHLLSRVNFQVVFKLSFSAWALALSFAEGSSP